MSYYQTPNYEAQGGSAWVIGPGGTLAAGGAGSVSLPAGASFAGTISIGGTAARWAFGSTALTNGTAMIYTGLAQLLSAYVSPIGSGTGAGTATGFQYDWSRAANGSFFALGLAGTLAFAGAGTVVWGAFGY